MIERLIIGINAAGVTAWDAYLSYSVDPGDLKDETKIAWPFAPGFVNARRIQAFRDAGGFEAAETAVAPYLKAGAGGFVMPRRSFERLTAPDAIANAASLDEARDLLRPYLLEEKLLARPNGEGVKLFAAVLIPDGFGVSDEAPEAQYWSRNITDTALERVVTSALNNALQRAEIERLGLPEDALDQISPH